MALAPDFTCDYGSQITVSAGTNVTIHGNGAVLDASRKGFGSFFTVPSGAALALDHLVLQNGFASFDYKWGGYVSARLHELAICQKQPLTTTIH